MENEVAILKRARELLREPDDPKGGMRDITSTPTKRNERSLGKATVRVLHLRLAARQRVPSVPRGSCWLVEERWHTPINLDDAGRRAGCLGPDGNSVELRELPVTVFPETPRNDGSRSYTVNACRCDGCYRSMDGVADDGVPSPAGPWSDETGVLEVRTFQPTIASAMVVRTFLRRRAPCQRFCASAVPRLSCEVAISR